MTEYTFSAKSSSGVPYLVIFRIGATGGVSIRCNCQAGMFGKLCKHKIALLRGEADMLANTEQETELETLQKIISTTDYPVLFQQIEQIETEIESAKRRITKIKKSIETLMNTKETD